MVNKIFKVATRVSMIGSNTVNLIGLRENESIIEGISAQLPLISQLFVNFENRNPYNYMLGNNFLVYDLPNFKCSKSVMLKSSDNVYYHTSQYYGTEDTDREYLFINVKLPLTDTTGIYLQVNARKHPFNVYDVEDTLTEIKECDRWHIKGSQIPPYKIGEHDWQSENIERRKVKNDALSFEMLFYKKFYTSWYSTSDTFKEEVDFIFNTKAKEISGIDNNLFESEMMIYINKKDYYDDLKIKKAHLTINNQGFPNFKKDLINRTFSLEEMQELNIISIIENCVSDKSYGHTNVHYSLIEVEIKKKETSNYPEEIAIENWIIPSAFLTDKLIL